MNTSDTVSGAIAGEPARWAIAGMFLEYLTARDYERLAATLAQGVRFRALQQGGPSEWHGRAEATDVFHSWFGEADGFEVVDATVGEIAGRLQMTWRIRLRPAPFDIGDGWHTSSSSTPSPTSTRRSRRSTWSAPASEPSGQSTDKTEWRKRP